MIDACAAALSVVHPGTSLRALFPTPSKLPAISRPLSYNRNSHGYCLGCQFLLSIEAVEAGGDPVGRVGCYGDKCEEEGLRRLGKTRESRLVTACEEHHFSLVEKEWVLWPGTVPGRDRSKLHGVRGQARDDTLLWLMEKHAPPHLRGA